MDRERVTDLGYTPIGGMDTTTRNVMKHNSLLMLRRPRRQLHTVAQMVGFVGSVFWLRCTLSVCVCACICEERHQGLLICMRSMTYPILCCSLNAFVYNTTKDDGYFAVIFA